MFRAGCHGRFRRAGRGCYRIARAVLQQCGNGTVDAKTSEVLVASEPNATAVPTAAPASEQTADTAKKTDKDTHVELNLNYSRLGVANKVDTYLNVRKKPSESGKVVGKMTKNAGCHVYHIKKAGLRLFPVR